MGLYYFHEREYISTNSKCFWIFVNSARNSSSIPSHMTNGVMAVNSYEGVADMFKKNLKYDESLKCFNSIA